MPQHKIGDPIPSDATVGMPIPADATIGTPAPEPSMWDKLTSSEDPGAAKYGPVGRFLSSAGGTVLNAPQSVASSVTHPIDTAKGLAEALPTGFRQKHPVLAALDPTGGALSAAMDVGERLKQGYQAGVLPEALGAGVGNVAVGEASGGVASKVPVARSAVGKAIHTEAGKLRPFPKTISQVAGGATGAAAGEAIGHPYLGGLAGYKLGPGLLEQVFPSPEVEPFTPYGPTRVNKADLTPPEEPPFTPYGPTRVNPTDVAPPGPFAPRRGFKGFTVSAPVIEQAGIPQGAMTPAQEMATRQAISPRMEVQGGSYTSRMGRTWNAGDLASWPREQLAGEYAREAAKPPDMQDPEWLQALRAESMRNPAAMYPGAAKVVKAGGKYSPTK